jgi:hypothetical protein
VRARYRCRSSFRFDYRTRVMEDGWGLFMQHCNQGMFLL